MLKVTNVKVHHGVAGQVSAVAVYDDGDYSSIIELVGSIYGGPVVLVTDASQVFVTDPSRFGDFGVDPRGYVRRFALGEEL